MPTDRQLETMRANGRRSAARRKSEGFYASEHQSRRRKQQLANEEAVANRLREQGYEVFSPTVVCDRIAVKDGKVYFVEIKRDGQALRPAQQLVSDLAPDRYLVVLE